LFIQHLIRNENYSLKTVSRKINTLKTLFKFLFENKHTKLNHAEVIQHPDFETKQPRILAALEYKALRDTVRGNLRLHTMIEILLQTGIRIGELSRMKITDLSKGFRTLKIESYASNPERKIELNEAAVKAIEKWLAHRPSVRNDQGYVFPTKSGRSVIIRNIRTSINRSFKKVGIKNATVNDIRNTFVVFQLENGVRIEKVAHAVGHQRLSSTEKYTELLEKPYTAKLQKIQVL
jgi:site-specific recombinase XerD